MSEALSFEEVVYSLSGAYKKTREYKKGAVFGIPKDHPLVLRQEKAGLKAIYHNFIEEPLRYISYRKKLENRTIGDWIKEWKSMHNVMFKTILKNRGDFRKVDVRFGYAGDEDLYHIPSWRDVPREMGIFAKIVIETISNIPDSNEDKYRCLAKVHYQFIRIHPFVDGNGRIGRTITDQLALYFGLPVAIAGYPRHNLENRERYHHAIRACASDPNCGELSQWIGGFIEHQLNQIA